MQRRCSDSTEEDDSEDNILSATNPHPHPHPRRSSNGQIASTFTSAKFDMSCHSDTLDRRKGDKTPAPHQLVEHATDSGFAAYEDGMEKLKSASVRASKKRELVQGTDKMELGQRGRLRSRSPWRLSLLSLVTTLASLILLWAMLNSFFKRQIDPKGCIKPYMAPGYAKLDGFDTEHTRFASKYSLWLYREYGVHEDTNVRARISP